ncbi:MAG: hypothetical protein QM765_43780 [Myxococcales bacterium]
MARHRRHPGLDLPHRRGGHGLRLRRGPSLPDAQVLTRAVLIAALLFAAPACTKPGPDPEEEARALQVDLHRALIETRSLGRFGELGLFEQEMERVPCQVPLSATNRVCEVVLQGRGPVRMQVADEALEKSDQLRKDALISVEYRSTECENARFDFKTVDNVLSRGPTVDGVTVWENKLLKVTHRRVPGTPADQCSLTIEAAPALLARVKAVGALRSAAASR